MTYEEDEDMDSSAMLRRAHERGERLETYDPNKLVGDVAAVLESHGLHPDVTSRAGMAAGATGMLLRAFGIVPACDYTSIDRLNAPDPDSR